jgi:cytochrome c-type biogenesis protein CcmF
VVHLGVVIVFLGVAGSSGYGSHLEQTVAGGESVAIGRYRLAFEGVRQSAESTHVAVVARFAVLNHETPVGRLEPAKLFYPVQQQPVARVAVRSTWREDLYLTLTDVSGDGARATVKAMVNPLVLWMWAGGLVMTLGTAWALLPDRRGRR